MTNKELGISIRVIREKNFLTQKEFADKLGVNKQAVYYWEKGEKRPTLKHMKLIDEFRKKALQENIEFKENELKLTKLKKQVQRKEREAL